MTDPDPEARIAKGGVAIIARNPKHTVKLKLKKEQLEEDTATVKKQDEDLAELKKKIEEEQKVCDDLTEKIDEGNKVKTKEDERNRYLHQTKSALSAKKEFIETDPGYDYTSHAEAMNLEVFRDLIRSNDSINGTVKGFVDKVDVVKQEVQKINADRFSYK